MKKYIIIIISLICILRLSVYCLSVNKTYDLKNHLLSSYEVPNKITIKLYDNTITKKESTYLLKSEEEISLILERLSQIKIKKQNNSHSINNDMDFISIQMEFDNSKPLTLLFYNSYYVTYSDEKNELHFKILEGGNLQSLKYHIYEFYS